MKRILAAVLTSWLFAPGASLACSFDTDCSPGNKCVKARGSIYGVCTGGISPGNRHDRAPVFSPLDPNRTTGNTCSFDTDCGPGSTCLKGAGSIEGACVRSRSGMNPRTRGNATTCSFDTDCAVGQKCLKSGHSYEGRCTSD
jgi:hypothetical protein